VGTGGNEGGIVGFVGVKEVFRGAGDGDM